MSPHSILLLFAAGLAGGLIDSVIGGGGLITLPAVMLHLGVRPVSIGTNKIGAFFCTLAAVSVYSRRMRWRTAFSFAAWVALGSVLGASVSPRWLSPAYPFLLGIGAFLCLAAVLFRNRLLSEREPSPASRLRDKGAVSPLAAGLGFLSGFYDGAWGPGGGTFMFLSLLYATPLGLMGSIAAAKIANLASSSFSLAAYAIQGYAEVKTGLVLGAGLLIGAFAGAKLALKHAERILVPLLVVISILLLVKLWSGLS